MACSRSVRSDTLLSIVSRPSPVYRRNAAHWFRAYVTAWPSADLGSTRPVSSSNFASIRSRIGTDSRCRSASRSSADQPNARSSMS